MGWAGWIGRWMNLSSTPLSPVLHPLYTKQYTDRLQSRPLRPVGREPTFSLSRCSRTRNSTHLPLPRSSPHWLTALHITSQWSNFTCCGLAIPDMHDLLAHFEDSHVFVLSKQDSSSDAQPSSVLASQTSPSPFSHQNDQYDPEPFVLSYPQPRALPSPCPISSLSSATQTFPGLGVCIPSGSRPSTPELSAAGSDSDPVSSSPASVFTPLSPFMPFSSAFSATSVSMESRMDEPAYPLLDCTSLSRVDHRLALDTDGEGATSMYAQDISVSYPFEGNCQQSQAQAHTLTLETNTNPSPDIHRTHPSILSLPPASFSLPASTRPTPAAKSKKSTTKKAGSGATSNRVHDLGRRIKERRGVVDVGGAGGGGACADAGTGAGSVSVVSRAGGRNYAGASKWNGGLSGLGRKTKRGARGKFVSNTTKTKERLVTGLGSGLRSGSGFSSGRALEVGRGCDERVSEDASQLVDHDPIAMADALSQASYPSIEQHERAEDLAADVGAGSGVASTSGRKSREKAFKCPVCDSCMLFFIHLCVAWNGVGDMFGSFVVPLWSLLLERHAVS